MSVWIILADIRTIHTEIRSSNTRIHVFHHTINTFKMFALDTHNLQIRQYALIHPSLPKDLGIQKLQWRR